MLAFLGLAELPIADVLGNHASLGGVPWLVLGKVSNGRGLLIMIIEDARHLGAIGWRHHLVDHHAERFFAQLRQLDGILERLAAGRDVLGNGIGVDPGSDGLGHVDGLGALAAFLKVLDQPDLQGLIRRHAVGLANHDRAQPRGRRVLPFGLHALGQGEALVTVHDPQLAVVVFPDDRHARPAHVEALGAQQLARHAFRVGFSLELEPVSVRPDDIGVQKHRSVVQCLYGLLREPYRGLFYRGHWGSRNIRFGWFWGSLGRQFGLWDGSGADFDASRFQKAQTLGNSPSALQGDRDRLLADAVDLDVGDRGDLTSDRAFREADIDGRPDLWQIDPLIRPGTLLDRVARQRTFCHLFGRTHLQARARYHTGLVWIQ